MEDMTTAIEEVVETASSEIMFEPLNFVSNLSYMGMGMLGIFIVIGVIWGVTVALNKLFSKKPKDEDASSN